MKTRFLTVATMIAATAAIAACSLDSRRGGSLRDQLGVAQGTPDEFLIIARAPIEVPSTFDLPRPQPGAPSRVEVDPLSDAHTALFQRPEPVRLNAPSGGEQVLLSGANAADDNSSVRTVLADEAPADVNERYGLSSLFGYRIPSNLGEESEDLDSVEENEALRNRGIPVPTAPPPPESRRGAGLTFIAN